MSVGNRDGLAGVSPAADCYYFSDHLAHISPLVGWANLGNSGIGCQYNRYLGVSLIFPNSAKEQQWVDELFQVFKAEQSQPVGGSGRRGTV